MNRNNNASSSSKFGTILIRRKANERPSELELRLRPLCGKIRIVEKIAGNAHLLVPGSPSLALRVYTAKEINKLEADDIHIEENGDLDGLQQFRDSFEHSMVFFVLPKGEGQNQLGRRESFLNTAQHILLMSNDEAEKKRASRILIVPDINQVINAISSVMQSLAPAKREKKKQYFAQRASQYYLPNQETGKDPTQAAIANHVSKTFHAWAERMGLPEGDSNVLLNIMGSLGDVATADDKALDDLPIRNVTKEIVSTFFGSSKSNEEPNNANDDTFDTGSITEAFDDIEDNEFLQIPNPNVMENTHPSQWQSENVHEEFNGFQENSYTQEQFFQPNHNNTRSVHSFAHGTNNFSNELDYTPIQPTYQSNHYHPREQYVEISIIPESFAQHHNFTPHSMQHGHGYRSSHSNGRAAPFRSASRSNYQRDNGFGPQQSM